MLPARSAPSVHSGILRAQLRFIAKRCTWGIDETFANAARLMQLVQCMSNVQMRPNLMGRSDLALYEDIRGSLLSSVPARGCFQLTTRCASLTRGDPVGLSPLE